MDHISRHLEDAHLSLPAELPLGLVCTANNASKISGPPWAYHNFYGSLRNQRERLNNGEDRGALVRAEAGEEKAVSSLRLREERANKKKKNAHL